VRLSFSKVAILVIGVSSLFLFLAWRECGRLWIARRNLYSEARYELEKESIRMIPRGIPYEMVDMIMIARLGISSATFVEVPAIPELKSMPFVAYKVDGGTGRGLDIGISVGKLKSFFSAGFSYGLKAGFTKRASASLEVKGGAFAKAEGELLKITQYVVKPGDTLWDIAKRFNITLDTIISANQLEHVDMLKIGQVLKVPSVSGVFHKVAKGETLEKIAKVYKVDLEQIRKYNTGLREVKAGSLVFIPGGKLLEETHPSKPRWIASRRSRREFVWPVNGRITSKFGWRRDPFSGRREFHTGIDISAPSGVPIRASRSGRVIYAGWRTGYGLLVIVDHGDGWETWYGHCSRINVRVGQYVAQGEIVGRVGSTGRTTGSHLHFEIRNNGNPVDPLYHLR